MGLIVISKKRVTDIFSYFIIGICFKIKNLQTMQVFLWV